VDGRAEEVGRDPSPLGWVIGCEQSATGGQGGGPNGQSANMLDSLERGGERGEFLGEGRGCEPVGQFRGSCAEIGCEAGERGREKGIEEAGRGRGNRASRGGWVHALSVRSVDGQVNGIYLGFRFMFCLPVSRLVFARGVALLGKLGQETQGKRTFTGQERRRETLDRTTGISVASDPPAPEGGPSGRLRARWSGLAAAGGSDQTPDQAFARRGKTRGGGRGHPLEVFARFSIRRGDGDRREGRQCRAARHPRGPGC